MWTNNKISIVYSASSWQTSESLLNLMQDIYTHTRVCVCAYCIYNIHAYNDQLYEYLEGKHLSPPATETPNFCGYPDSGSLPEGLSNLLTSQGY